MQTLRSRLQGNVKIRSNEFKNKIKVYFCLPYMPVVSFSVPHCVTSSDFVQDICGVDVKILFNYMTSK